MRYRNPRIPLDREVRVVHADGIHRGELANISATGARLRNLPPLPPNSTVKLCHLHLQISAKVVWSENGQTGICFAAPLSSADVQSVAGNNAMISNRHSLPQHGFRELE